MNLIGREPELRQMLAALERARLRSVSSLVIEGEAGLGKTRLCEEILAYATAQAWLTMEVRCAELDVDRPFVALADAVEELCSNMGEQAPSEFEDSLGLIRSAAQGFVDINGEKIASLILEGIQEVAQTTPILVVFEDAHWIDEASARVLWGLARGRRKSQMMLLFTFRPTSRPLVQSLRRGLDSQGVANIILRALSPRDAEALGQQVLGQSLSPTAMRLLHDSDGNPLFITELLGGLRDFDEDNNSDGEPIPNALRSLVLRRLGAFSDRTRQLLLDAALLGNEFDLPSLANLHGISLEELLRQLAPALENRVLVDRAGVVGFQHGLVQKIVSESISETPRRLRHRDLARQLSLTNLPSTKIAEHVWKSFPYHDTSACEFLRRIGDEVRSLSIESALTWMERALACARDGMSTFEIQIEIAILNLLLGRVSDAESICISLDSPALSVGEEIRRRITIGALTTIAGRSRQDEAILHVEWLIDHFDEDDPEKLEMLGWKALLFLYRGELDVAEQIASQCLHRVVGAERDPNSRAYEALALVRLLRGESEEAKKYADLAIRTYDLRPNAFTSITTPHFTQAMAMLSTEPIERVLQVIDDGFRQCDRAGHTLARLHLDPIHAICRFIQGDIVIASACTERVLDRGDEWQTGGIALPTISGLAAYIALLRNDLPTARALADRTLEELLAGGAQAGSADFAVFCVAKVAEADRDPDKARNLLQMIWDLFARDASLFTVAPDLVRLTRETSPDSARDVVERAEARSFRSGAPLDRANALACRGHLLRDPRLLLRATAEWEELGWTMAGAQARSAVLEFYSDGLPKAERNELLLNTVAIWERMDLLHPVGVLRRLYPRVSGTAGATKPQGADALSQSERAVARLVCEGLTNKEIAQRLFVSHRTVDTHVSHALAKLGLSSRVQLASTLARQPIS